MTKLTPAQAQARQARLDRIAEVRAAQSDSALSSDNQRIREYNKSGAQPVKVKSSSKGVQNSLQYRFAAFKVKACRELTIAPEGMSPAFAVAYEAYCQALVELKPTCDTRDTGASQAVHTLINKLTEAASLSNSSVAFNWDLWSSVVQAEFAKEYKGTISTLNCFPVLNKEQTALFKANALAQIKDLIKSTYVSLR